MGGEDNSQSLLMGIVSQIAAEPTVDYKQDIWQLQLRDLRKACLECIRWPHTRQLPCVRSETATGSMWRVLFLSAYQVGLNYSHFVDAVTPGFQSDCKSSLSIKIKGKWISKLVIQTWIRLEFHL